MHRSFFFLVFAAACGRTDLLADAPVVEQPPPLELRRTVFMAVADRAWRLFATDGTADGTRAIGLVNVDTSGGVPEPGQSFGGRHYFPCAGALCVSDGATSTRFLDLNAHRLTVAAGSLFFLTDPGTLWRSVDGQSAAVVHSSPGTVSLLVANERALVFWADGALWRITPGDRESARVGDHLERVPDAVELGDTLFFVGFDPAHGKELWKSTGAGALERVTDLTPGPGLEPVCDRVGRRRGPALLRGQLAAARRAVFDARARLGAHLPPRGVVVPAAHARRCRVRLRVGRHALARER